MKGDPVHYVLQVLVGRESEYKQVRTSVHGVCVAPRVRLAPHLSLLPRMTQYQCAAFFLKLIIETAYITHYLDL